MLVHTCKGTDNSLRIDRECTYSPRSKLKQSIKNKKLNFQIRQVDAVINKNIMVILGRFNLKKPVGMKKKRFFDK